MHQSPFPLLSSLCWTVPLAFAQTYPVSKSDATFVRDCVGRETENLFVLTFDDGPAEGTAPIMDILKEKDAPATFFVVGSIFDDFPGFRQTNEDLVRRAVREGHIVSNHGMTNDEFTLQEVQQCEDEVRQILGDDSYNMRYFRPAQGKYTTAKHEGLIDTGYKMIMWNLDVADWRPDRNPDDVLALIDSVVWNPTSPAPSYDSFNYGLPRRGSFVMLAHDYKDLMVRPVASGQPLLSAMIDTIRSAGFRIVSLDECLGEETSGGGAIAAAPAAARMPPPTSAPSAPRTYPASRSDETFVRDCVGRESDNLFVLTFVDGPAIPTTPILDILKEKDAPATFFVVGSIFDDFPGYRAANEDIVRRAVREGHVVGNKGMSSDEFTLREVQECEDEIHVILGGDYDVRYFRPARGLYTASKHEGLVDMGYKMIMWNLDTSDWKSDRTPDDVLALVQTAVRNPTAMAPSDDVANYGLPRRGSFIMLSHDSKILMHEPVSSGVPLLSAIIDTVRSAGFYIVSLDECLGGQSDDQGATVPATQAATTVPPSAAKEDEAAKDPEPNTGKEDEDTKDPESGTAKEDEDTKDPEPGAAKEDEDAKDPESSTAKEDEDNKDPTDDGATSAEGPTNSTNSTSETPSGVQANGTDDTRDFSTDSANDEFFSSAGADNRISLSRWWVGVMVFLFVSYS